LNRAFDEILSFARNPYSNGQFTAQRLQELVAVIFSSFQQYSDAAFNFTNAICIRQVDTLTAVQRNFAQTKSSP